ncbi:MAG: hypothetical protein Q9168_000061 [Polycauliona sp. 1 TL-2023]
MTRPTVDSDVNSSKFLERLTSFPAVSTGIEAVKTNPITAAPLAVAKRTSLLVATPVFPLASLSYFMLEPLIEPLIKKVDNMAHDSLHKIESTWPLIKERPEHIKAEVEHLVFLPWTKSKERKEYVASTYSNEYSQCGRGGIRSIGRAVICTQLIVLSDGLLWIKAILSGGHEQSLGHVDSNYELDLQVAEMRKQPAYVPKDLPPPTIFAIKCHPKADQVCAELDEYFFKNWPWKSEAEGQKFLRSETNRWGCLALPNALDDRIYDSVRVNTLLFLLDDVAETMSFAEGKALYKRLTPIALGKTLPNRNDPYEWMTYDTWKSLRDFDPELTEVVWEGALLCVTAQVDDARTRCPDLGSLLKHREKEAGIAFVAAVLQYAQALHVTAADTESISAIFTSYALLGVTVNDILSFDKELRALRLNPDAEGASILNMTQALSNDTELNYEASKRVLWVLCREWEVKHQRMVKERLAKKDVSKDLEDYLEGMEYVLGGNEWWSWRTERYQDKKLV